MYIIPLPSVVDHTCNLDSVRGGGKRARSVRGQESILRRFVVYSTKRTDMLLQSKG